jgi:putative hydrolase of the HAD superfamily
LDQQYPKGALFDLDDTILSINASVEESWRKVSADFSSRYSGLSAGNLMDAINVVREWYWGDLERHRRGRLNLDLARREVVEIALARLGINDSRAAGELSGAYGKEIEKNMQPFPGAIDTLKHFRRNNIMLALVTNGASEIQRRKIRRFDLEPLFDFIVIESEFGFGKPDERVFQHALNQLGIDKKDAWMIGDDLARDVAGAKQAGIPGIWVDWQNKGLPESSIVQPDRIIRSISELV